MSEGLLVVVFDPAVTPAKRAEAMKQVGGTLLPRPKAAADSEYYVRAAPGTDDQQLQALADQLIQLEPVRTVSSAECPPPLPKATSDTGRPQ